MPDVDVTRGSDGSRRPESAQADRAEQDWQDGQWEELRRAGENAGAQAAAAIGEGGKTQDELLRLSRDRVQETFRAAEAASEAFADSIRSLNTALTAAFGLGDSDAAAK